MQPWVDIRFDCLPLRNVSRLDPPLDASPNLQKLFENVKAAIAKHGRHNAYYLYNARCAFHLTNRQDIGLVEFSFEGVALTDPADAKTINCDLNVILQRETCDWLNQNIVNWLAETVTRAVRVEFDRYIEAGDLAQASARVAKLEEHLGQSGGYVGMDL
jgi:hypothetical protein